MYGFLVYPNHPELQIADANPACRRPGEKPNILAQLQRGPFNVHPGTPKGTVVMVETHSLEPSKKTFKTDTNGTSSCHKVKFLKYCVCFRSQDCINFWICWLHSGDMTGGEENSQLRRSA